MRGDHPGAPKWTTPGDLLGSSTPRCDGVPYWPHLASHLASAARTGVNIHRLVTSAAEQVPLPDELHALPPVVAHQQHLSPPAPWTPPPPVCGRWLPA